MHVYRPRSRRSALIAEMVYILIAVASLGSAAYTIFFPSPCHSQTAKPTTAPTYSFTFDRSIVSPYQGDIVVATPAVGSLTFGTSIDDRSFSVTKGSGITSIGDATYWGDAQKAPAVALSSDGCNMTASGGGLPTVATAVICPPTTANPYYWSAGESHIITDSSHASDLDVFPGYAGGVHVHSDDGTSVYRLTQEEYVCLRELRRAYYAEVSRIADKHGIGRFTSDGISVRGRFMLFGFTTEDRLPDIR